MEVEQIMTAFFDAWARGDVNAVVEAFTDDAVYHNIPMPPCNGKDAIREFVSGFLSGTASSVRFQVRHQSIDGNRVMNERVDTIELADRSIDLPVCGIFELSAEGKIAAWRDYFDLGQFR